MNLEGFNEREKRQINLSLEPSPLNMLDPESAQESILQELRSVGNAIIVLEETRNRVEREMNFSARSVYDGQSYNKTTDLPADDMEAIEGADILAQAENWLKKRVDSLQGKLNSMKRNEDREKRLELSKKKRQTE